VNRNGDEDGTKSSCPGRSRGVVGRGAALKVRLRNTPSRTRTTIKTPIYESMKRDAPVFSFHERPSGRATGGSRPRR